MDFVTTTGNVIIDLLHNFHLECGARLHKLRVYETLTVSQPVVSKAIADLEHALGVRLLDRSRRGVEPTPYGRALIKRGVAIFDESDKASRRSNFCPIPRRAKCGSERPIRSMPLSWRRSSTGSHGNIRG